MLTADRLAHLSASDDHHETAKVLRTYIDGLAPHEQSNLMSLAEMNDRHALDKMVSQAKAAGNEKAATFVQVAAIIRRTQDAIGTLQKVAELADEKALAAGETEPAKPPYELPVISFAGKPEYAVLAVMQKGVPLKLTKVNGWGAIGSKPADRQYTTPELVADLLARHVIVPAPGQSWDDPSECYLSAIGWRGMGCLYTDKSSQIELRTYELCGSEFDNPTARRWRSIIAEWRARQARRDTTPAWNRYAEFAVTVSDKTSGDGVKTVTVVFECGRVGASTQNPPDHFEFFGPVNAGGYHQHIQAVGATPSKTVTQVATEIASKMCAEFAAEKKAAAKPAKVAKPKPEKPVAPPLAILDADDDADAMARELGLM